ncbi:MAG: PASTA domain-containing protein [Flavobacteriales bacterium]|nr:MAG: PASTA domain-containing protein [Flavobacteriales bacterium]|tara:strand:- start:595 stop:1182 length:588 start_codon:yes stop_codon:yes gene_type:complete
MKKIIKIIKAILRVYLKLLKSDSIVKHLFASSITVFIIFYFVFISVKIYTKHNRYIEVPSLSGLNIEDANKILKKKKLKFEVLDSSKYFSETPVNFILSQIPDAGEFVKKNRKIYLNVNPSDYQKVSIPNIIQITKRNAESILNALGFEVSSFQYVDNIGKDMVLEVLYNGEKMNIGDAIARGSKLELILGNGKK